MAATSPDFESHFLEKLSELAPSDFIITGVNQNTWPGEEQPVTQTPMKAAFAQAFGGTNIPHTDGRFRQVGINFTVRSERGQYEDARAWCAKAIDTMDNLGRWSPASSPGTVYADCVCADATPVPAGVGPSDERYFTVTFYMMFVEN